MHPALEALSTLIPHASVTSVVCGGLTIYLAYKLVRLCFADADLALLEKGPCPHNAFEGKVVWITGALASQRSCAFQDAFANRAETLY